jgi:hypothetical protein
MVLASPRGRSGGNAETVRDQPITITGLTNTHKVGLTLPAESNGSSRCFSIRYDPVASGELGEI